MSAPMLARRLGGTVAGRGKVIVPGPGHSASDRSLSVLLDPAAPDGFTTHSFAGDDWKLCRDHVREQLGLQPKVSVSHEPPRPHAVVRPVSTTAYAHRLWCEAEPITGSLAERYLLARGLTIPDDVLSADALRFRPACPFRLTDGTLVRLPTMLGAMVDIVSGSFRGVHRTALSADGSTKANTPGLGNPKKMLGTAKGACIKLSADDTVTTGLHIAEGIETALACMAMGFAPIWSALSASGIAHFPILPGVEVITILSDNDANGTGCTVARACAKHWTDAAREARILSPPFVDSDWTDVSAVAP